MEATNSAPQVVIEEVGGDDGTTHAAEANAADGGITEDDGHVVEELAKAYELPKDCSWKLGDNVKFPGVVKNMIKNWNDQGKVFPVMVDCQVNYAAAQWLLHLGDDFIFNPDPHKTQGLWWLACCRKAGNM